jgi:hypothetical protein
LRRSGHAMFGTRIGWRSGEWSAPRIPDSFYGS